MVNCLTSWRMIRTLLGSFYILLLMTGCCIHQEPKPPVPPVEPPSERAFILRLEFDCSMPLLGEHDYGDGHARGRAASDDADRPHDIRYTIRAYSTGRGGISRSADTTYVFTRPYSEGYDATFELELPPGDHCLMVWADHVDAGSFDDKYYATDDFGEIMLQKRSYGHTGSNPWRDAFSGRVETTVESRADDGSTVLTPVSEATVRMARPMARYRFISTDLARFMGAVENRRSDGLDRYIIRMVYTRYMPCSYNMFTDRPADSWTGIDYISEIHPVSATEAELAFDYVFVNGSQTAVTVGVEVYDSDGALLAGVPAFDVPLKRSMETVVRGEFLTTRASGSVGVDPGFDGSFEIFIH